MELPRTRDRRAKADLAVLSPRRPFTGQIYEAREKRRAEAAAVGPRGASSAVKAEARSSAVRRA